MVSGAPWRLGDSWLSVVLNNAFIFLPDNAFAVDSFEPTNGEMTLSHLLKMLDERVIHEGAAQCADDREGLRCYLLRYDHSETGRHLCNEAHGDWTAFLDSAAFRDEACGFSYTLRQHAAHREISTFRRIGG